MFHRTAKTLLTISLILATGQINAQDDSPAGWHGTGEFGFVKTGGNTDTESLNLGLEFIYEKEKWRYTLNAAAQRSEQDGNTDAQRWTVGAQSDYKFSEKSYWFGSFRHESDKFAGFDPVSTVAVGYGRELIHDERHFLLGETGIGYRTEEDATTGESEENVIFRGRLDYRWTISANSEIANLSLVESGSDNTYFQNDTSLNVAINSRFAVKLAFQYRYNSNPPPGKDDTDTQFTTNLVYNF
ncbi:MAG: DUF481 domain-containing protein [Xanthomonadales bacterium]|nr:DUF481 domain-containing protein [Xanthomonadales bacterium]